MLLVDVFAHELTFGYQRQWCVVQTYNGVDITSLRHLRELWHATRAAVARAGADGAGADGAAAGAKKSEFVRLELEYCDDIVFEARAAMEAEADILKTHAIARPHFIVGDA